MVTGGDFDTLQRNDNVTTFVKRGAREAKINIELYNEEGNNWEVGSVISDKGKFSWTINGEKAVKSQVSIYATLLVVVKFFLTCVLQVEDLVSKLNIQTSNMCQFLPQDVVKNFPLMSPQERFLNTVRAVGEGKLVDQFDKLKEIQQTIVSSNGLIITKESTLDSLKHKLDSIASKKDKIDEIDKMVSHKILSQKKLKWAIFENDIANAKKVKKKYEEVKEELKACEEAISKCIEVDKKKEEEQKLIEDKMAVPESVIQGTERFMMEPEVSKKLMELDHVEQLIANEDEEKVERSKRLDAAKAEVEKISRELKYCPSDSVLDIELSKLKEKENEINNKIHNLSGSKSELNYKLKSLKQSTKVAQKSLYELRSAETQKLNQLKKSNPECWGAVMHLRQNLKGWRDSGRFQHGIHEPAVLSLSVPNLDYSVYIEKETGGLQLEAFVCEDAKEANDLMQELRQHFQKVSVIHGDLNKMSQFQGPGGERYLSRPRPEELEKLKFVGFVGDMFSGPDAVKTHLFMHTGVFNTAVFSEETQYTNRIGELFPTLRKYYVGKVLNNVRVSKYSKMRTRGEEDISYFKPQRLKINFDQEEISKLDKQISEQVEEMSVCEKHILKINDTESKNRQELSQLKKDISENNEAKVNKNNLEVSLKHKKELIEELAKPCNDESHAERIETYKEEKKNITRELVKMVQSLQELLSKSSLQYLEQDLLRLKQNHLLEKFSVNSNELAKKQGEQKDLQKSANSWERKLNAAKDKLRVSKDDAHNCTADEGVEVSKKPPPKYAEQFEKVAPKTIEELEAHIDALSKEIQAENNVIKEQVRIKKMYDEKKSSVDKLESELEVLRKQKHDASKESEMISTVGVKKLQTLIEKVNDKFSSYFADLGYAGQVVGYNVQLKHRSCREVH